LAFVFWHSHSVSLAIVIAVARTRFGPQFWIPNNGAHALVPQTNSNVTPGIIRTKTMIAKMQG
jgi:hypothetical protein